MATSSITSFFLDALEYLRPWYIKISISLIIIFIGLILASMTKRILKRVLAEIELNTLFKKATSFELDIEKIIRYFSQYFIIFLAVIFALETLGWRSVILYILLFSFVTMLIISFLLALKDFFPNVISGFYLQKSSIIKLGNHIKVKNIEGEIIKLNLVEVTLKTTNGDEIVIPYSLLTKNEVINIKKSRKSKRN